MELITKLWFAEGRIYILTDKGNTYSRPLEAFPLLLEATPEQRQRFVIGLDGEDIRWEEIDEDIHISSFYNTEEPNPDNVIADVFRRFPQLNVSEVARYIGINKNIVTQNALGPKGRFYQAKRLKEIPLCVISRRCICQSWECVG